MASGNNNGKRVGSNNGNNNGNSNISREEAAELSAEDYEIIAAALIALGEVFSFLSLVKAKQVTKESGGEIGVPEIFTLSTRKSLKGKRR